MAFAYLPNTFYDYKSSKERQQEILHQHKPVCDLAKEQIFNPLSWPCTQFKERTTCDTHSTEPSAFLHNEPPQPERRLGNSSSHVCRDNSQESYSVQEATTCAIRGSQRIVQVWDLVREGSSVCYMCRVRSCKPVSLRLMALETRTEPGETEDLYEVVPEAQEREATRTSSQTDLEIAE